MIKYPSLGELGYFVLFIIVVKSIKTQRLFFLSPDFPLTLPSPPQWGRGMG
jgi:hypothetical protein